VKISADAITAVAKEENQIRARSKVLRGKYFPSKSSWFPLDLKLVPYIF
jgi:hypothetical protein